MTKPNRYWSSKRGQGEAYRWLCSHVDYASDDCLIFPFFKNPETGYGSFGFEGSQRYAHRFICELAHGPAPEGAPYCAHSCGRGNEGCVNPKHLSWKSVSGNLLDRRDHGTVRNNTNGPVSKLAPEMIAAIRSLKGVKSQYEVARFLGVKRPVVQYWQKHEHEPATPGTSRSAAWRRRQKAAGAKASDGYRLPAAD
jgi:hypothetical protein